MRKASKSQWIKFGIVALLYLLFTIWVGNYFLLLGLPILFDIYVSKIVPWGAWKKSKNPAVRKVAEWTDAIIFALIAVYIINLFIFQNYKIPTSSLEKTLLVGDFLFVSKLSYGPRVPNTPLSFPLAQHTMPVIDTKSYIEWPQWPYKRLKGVGVVERNDIVVFNFPAGDTVALKRQETDFYTLSSYYGRNNVVQYKEEFGDIVYRPVDRRENYVKRCIGMPGDSLQIIANQVYINGQKLENPEKMQLNYLVETTGSPWNEKTFSMLDVSKDDRKFINSEAVFEYVGIESAGVDQTGRKRYNPVYQLPLTREALGKLEKSGYAKKIVPEPAHFFGGITYPLDYPTGWTRDDYGPIWIPQKGATIQLTPLNIALYKRCIVNYENNTLEEKNGRIYINGQVTDTFTFRYDYYFMMGDNRHNSADSRSWGFVPEDHVVGKPLVVWLSLDKDKPLFKGGIRWKRLFKYVGND